MKINQMSMFLCALPLVGACAAGPLDGPPGTETGETGEPGQPEAPTPLEQGLDLDDRSGNLRLFLTDAPADFDAVWVEVSEVQLGRGEGEEQSWHTVSDGPLAIDLLSLQNDVTAVLGDAELEPGYYGQARFIVASAEAVSGDESLPLKIPSGGQTGIKLNLDFQLEPELAYAVVLDFDALASIKQTGAGLLMEPVIQVEYIGIVNEDGSLTPLVEVEDAGDDEAGTDDQAGTDDEAGTDDQAGTDDEAGTDDTGNTPS